jgi:hypothetical protein
MAAEMKGEKNLNYFADLRRRESNPAANSPERLIAAGSGSWTAVD